MCRCGMGMFGIGILRIGMRCCWQQACTFMELQWTPHAAAAAGAAVHTKIMARAAHGRREMVVERRGRIRARTLACASRGEENMNSVYVLWRRNCKEFRWQS